MRLMSVMAGLVMFGAGAVALASNYPPDYCHQNVRVLHDGPGLFAHVGSGCDGMEIFGYKKSGYLAYSNPEYVDAVVVARCNDDGRVNVKTIRLGREWHGTGYMSEPLSFYHFIPSGCDTGAKLEVAYTADGKWDSRYGYNFGHFDYGFYNDQRDIATFATHEAGWGQIVMSAWDFIVEQMKK